MTIELEGPDGAVIEFPDGTATDVIKGVMSKRYASSSAPKKETTGNIPALLEGAAQGVTFGFSDEIEGGARALYGKVTGDQRPISDIYGEAVAKPRQRIADAQDTNPWAYYSGEIGGGLAMPGGLARAGIQGPLARTIGQRLATRSWAAAKEGSAYGAAYGAGKSEGGPINMATGTLTGAGTGAAFGSVIPGAVDTVGAVVRGATAPLRSYMRPQEFAGAKFGEAITRDVPQGGAARFADRVTDMQATNPSVRTMDAGGENVRSLMRAATNMPNPSRESAKRFMDARQANQHARMTDDLQKGLNEGRNFYATIDDQVTKMETIGKQAIEPALKIETPMTPALDRVLRRPSMVELQRLVNKKIADEDKPIGLITRTEMVHRIKMEIDDQMGAALQAKKMGNSAGAGWDYNTLKILKRDLLNAVNNPGYKSGLKRYAGEAQLKTAAARGFDDFDTMAPEQITKTLKEFDTEAERQIFRMGAARAIIDKLRTGNAHRDRTENVFGSPQMQMKLRALFPSQKQYREFQKSLVIEAKMADSRKALQGNSTTAKQATEGMEAGVDPIEVVRGAHAGLNVLGGRFGPAMEYLARGRNRLSGITPPVADELLRLGLSKDPTLANALAQSAVRRSMEVGGQRARVGNALIGGGAAASSPRQSAPLQIDLTYDEQGRLYPTPR
jgi:hypothetical protein